MEKDYAIAFYSLGICYYNANDPENAITNLKKALELRLEEPYVASTKDFLKRAYDQL